MQILIAGVPRCQIVPALFVRVMDLSPASAAIEGTDMGLQDAHKIPCPQLGSCWLWPLWLMSRLRAGLPQARASPGKKGLLGGTGDKHHFSSTFSLKKRVRCSEARGERDFVSGRYLMLARPDTFCGKTLVLLGKYPLLHKPHCKPLAAFPASTASSFQVPTHPVTRARKRP